MLKSLALASAIMLIPAMSGPSDPMQAQAGPQPYLPTFEMVPLPPPDLRSAPDGPAVIAWADPATVDAACRAGSGLIGGTIFACTFPAERVQIMPDPCIYAAQGEVYAALQCHENGHLPRKDGRYWRH